MSANECLYILLSVHVMLRDKVWRRKIIKCRTDREILVSNFVTKC